MKHLLWLAAALAALAVARADEIRDDLGTAPALPNPAPETPPLPPGFTPDTSGGKIRVKPTLKPLASLSRLQLARAVLAGQVAMHPNQQAALETWARATLAARRVKVPKAAIRAPKDFRQP